MKRAFNKRARSIKRNEEKRAIGIRNDLFLNPETRPQMFEIMRQEFEKNRTKA